MLTEEIDAPPEAPTVRLDRETYYALAERGFFYGHRVMLLEGELIEMPPMGQAHIWILTVLNEWLVKNFSVDHQVRIQMPLNVGPNSDPEPDAAIIPKPARMPDDHPQTAKLVIEVSDSSLRTDRRKAKLYASAGVEEYWIINISARCIEVHRGPNIAQKQFAEMFVVNESKKLSPLVRPHAVMDLGTLFN